jgi:hypothetical protein
LTSNNFTKTLLSAVDESLSSLGNSSKQALLFHLESSFRLKKENIPMNLTEFSKALEGIFGPGATHLEKLIIIHLREKLNLDLKDSECMDFQECMDNLKKLMKSKGECIAQ